MCDNTSGHFERSREFRKRDVTILSNQFLKKSLMRREFSVPWWTSYRSGVNGPGLTQFALPSHPGRGRQLEARSRRATTQTFRKIFLKPHSKR